MLLLENELGWRLHKHWAGYAIRRAHPPLRSRIGQFGIAFITVLMVVFIRLRDSGKLPYVLSVVAALIFVLWLFGSKWTKRLVLAVIPGLLIFFGLVSRDDITANQVIFAFPFAVLLGLYLFRPTVLYINAKNGRIFDGSFVPLLPVSHFRIEVRRPHSTQLHGVYVQDSEGPGEYLVWLSTCEAEASGVADDLRKWGVEKSIAPQDDNVIKANKKACRLVMAGYIAAVVILLLVLVIWLPHERDKSSEGVDIRTAMLPAKIIIGFLFLSVLPLGLYLGLFGWRAIRHQRVPPPATLILADTRILEGRKAVVRGRIMVALSALLIGASLIGFLYLPRRIE